MSKKVMVIMGGFSSEHDVSLVSGKCAAKALKKNGYEVISHKLNDVDKFFKALKKEKPDAVFNALHGTFGEDGTVQGFLDMMQVPYTHSGLMSSAIGMDKVLTKKLCKTAGVRIVDTKVFKAKDFAKVKKDLKMPYVIKPVADGSSVGVFVVKNEKDEKKVKYTNGDVDLMVEKFVDGKELTVMVLQDKAYVVTELKPKMEFYDYKAKYTSGMTEHVVPAEIPASVAKECMDYAVKAHKMLGCNTISRSDFRYNPKDGVVFLEINTNPGLTPLSLAPEQAQYAGISYEKLCSILVENAKCHLI